MKRLIAIPPLQSQVIGYMSKRHPDWPLSFCEWYGNRFWDHYQSCGWKLAKNLDMKDWEAAVRNNWDDLKWPATDKLIECKKNQPITKANSILSLYENFKKGIIDKQGMADSYKELRASGAFKFTKEETENLVGWAGNNKEYGRYLSVKLYFTKLINQENDKSGSIPVAGAAAD